MLKVLGYKGIKTIQFYFLSLDDVNPQKRYFLVTCQSIFLKVLSTKYQRDAGSNYQKTK